MSSIHTSIKITNSANFNDVYIDGSVSIEGDIVINDLTALGTITANTITDGVASLNNGTLTGLVDPVDNTDATNKGYVDERSLPIGGNTNQILTKLSNDNYDTGWTDAQAASGVPLGGLTGQLLAKASNADLDTEWTGDLNVENIIANTVMSNTITDGVASLNDGTLTGLVDPVDNTDATNKEYVDERSLPTGGNTSQILTKLSNADYDADWEDAPSGLPLGGLTGQILAKTSDLDLAVDWVYPGTANRLCYFDNERVLSSIDSITVNDSQGLGISQTVDVPNTTISLNSYSSSVSPSANSVNNQVYLMNSSFNVNNNGSFEFYDVYDTNRSININANVNNLVETNLYINQSDSVNCENFTFCNYYADINGTINTSIKGVGVGFVLYEDSDLTDVFIDGYRFDPTINSGTITGNTNMNGISLNPGISESITSMFGLNVGGYGTSSPENFIGVNCSPDFEGVIQNFQGARYSNGNNSNITNFQGVSIYTENVTNSYEGININSDIPSLSSFNGINIFPTIDEVSFGNGISIDVSNVSPIVGNPSTVTIQDLTYTSQANGANNISIEYYDGPLDVITSGNIVQVTFVNGVTLASDIKTAIEAYAAATFLVQVAITGLDVAQTSPVGNTPLTGGVSDGVVKAGRFTGDVFIDGDLEFTGVLSVGQLNSFYQQDIVSGSFGVPASLDSLITAIIAPEESSFTSADTIGINTASLITIGSNTSVTTNLTGITALGLPAVVSMATGSTVDLIAGGTFALSLDPSGTGGTIDEIALCRSVAIPNGVTAVTKLKGYAFALPFGDVGTDRWGVYIEPICGNYMRGSLNIGGAIGTDDVVSDASIGLEITDKHISTKQTTPPTIGTFSGTNSGSLVTSTDIAGIISLTTGAPFATGSQCVITFDTPYAQAPIIQLTPRNDSSGLNAIRVYVTSTANDFTIQFQTAEVGINTYEWFYTIIQTI